MEYSLGKTETDLKATFIKTAYRVKACTDGMMDECMWECGRITRWRGKENKLGRMESATKDNTTRTRSMAKEHSIGRPDTFTLVNGRMVSKKVKVS